MDHHQSVEEGRIALAPNSGSGLFRDTSERTSSIASFGTFLRRTTAAEPIFGRRSRSSGSEARLHGTGILAVAVCRRVCRARTKRTTTYETHRTAAAGHIGTTTDTWKSNTWLENVHILEPSPVVRGQRNTSSDEEPASRSWEAGGTGIQAVAASHIVSPRPMKKTTTYANPH